MIKSISPAVCLLALVSCDGKQEARADLATERPATLRIVYEAVGPYAPDYVLEVRADGSAELVWLNGGSTRVVELDCDRAQVGALFEECRRMEFISLKGGYVAGATDIPFYVLTLEDGGERKSVVFSWMGGTREEVAEFLPPEIVAEWPTMEALWKIIEDARGIPEVDAALQEWEKP